MTLKGKLCLQLPSVRVKKQFGQGALKTQGLLHTPSLP